MYDMCQSISNCIKPSEQFGEVLGVAMSVGGTVALTSLRNGNLVEGVVVCCLTAAFGRVLYFVTEAAFVQCGICQENARQARSQALESRICAPVTMVQSINKVMKSVVIGAFPGWGISQSLIFPSLTFGSAVFYLVGALAPSATLALVIGIVQDIQKRCINTTPAVVTGPLRVLEDIPLEDFMNSQPVDAESAESKHEKSNAGADQSIVSLQPSKAYNRLEDEGDDQSLDLELDFEHTTNK